MSPLFDRLIGAFRRDSWLQLSAIAFIIVLFGALEQPSTKRGGEAAPDGYNIQADGQRVFDATDNGPLIVELPAPSEAATHIIIAQLSGREVHLKDENGAWRIMTPPVDKYGRIQDHSDTLIALARASCPDDANPDLKAAFMKLHPDTRKVMCEMAAAS